MNKIPPDYLLSKEGLAFLKDITFFYRVYNGAALVWVEGHCEAVFRFEKKFDLWVMFNPFLSFVTFCQFTRTCSASCGGPYVVEWKETKHGYKFHTICFDVIYKLAAAFSFMLILFILPVIDAVFKHGWP